MHETRGGVSSDYMCLQSTLRAEKEAQAKSPTTRSACYTVRCSRVEDRWVYKVFYRKSYNVGEEHETAELGTCEKAGAKLFAKGPGIQGFVSCEDPEYTCRLKEFFEDPARHSPWRRLFNEMLQRDFKEIWSVVRTDPGRAEVEQHSPRKQRPRPPPPEDPPQPPPPERDVAIKWPFIVVEVAAVLLLAAILVARCLAR